MIRLALILLAGMAVTACNSRSTSSEGRLLTGAVVYCQQNKC